MKKTLIALAALLLIVFTLIIIPALIPDEEYTTGAAQWLMEANNPPHVANESNRFNALVGLHTAADKNIFTQGALLIANSNKVFEKKEFNNSDILSLNSAWKNSPLPVSKSLSDLYIDKEKENKEKWLSSNQILYGKMLTENNILLDRFKHLITIKEYSNTLIPHIEMPIVNLSGLIKLNLLNNLEIIDDFVNNNKKKAMDRLQENIIYCKRMMRQSASLIEKIIAVNLLKENLDTYQTLLDHPENVNQLNFNIDNLTNEERTLKKAYQHEFSYLSTALYLDDNRSIFNSENDKKSIFEWILIKYYLKPKKLENLTYKEQWTPLLAAEHQPLAKRKNHIHTINSYEPDWWGYYTDPIGNILFAIAMPAYTIYADKIDNLDGYITLINIKSEIYSRSSPLSNTVDFISKFNAEINPGYAGAKLAYSKDKHEIAFDIPGYTNDEILNKNKLIYKVKLYKNIRK
jgi:hypothetical protein